MAQKPNKPLPPPPSPDMYGPLSEVIPDTFPNTQRVPLYVARFGEKGFYDPTQTGEKTRTNGVLGSYNPFSGQTIKEIKDTSKPLKLSPAVKIHNAARNDKATVGHEAGHSIYIHDIPSESRYVFDELNRKTSITEYGPDDPAHAFAELYGMYVANPEYLQKKAPEIYNFIRNLAGFEYSRKPTKK